MEDLQSFKHSVGPEEIVAALRKTGWNKAKAARILDIGRRTIYRKIAAYQIACES